MIWCWLPYIPSYQFLLKYITYSWALPNKKELDLVDKTHSVNRSTTLCFTKKKKSTTTEIKDSNNSLKRIEKLPRKQAGITVCVCVRVFSPSRPLHSHWNVLSCMPHTQMKGTPSGTREIIKVIREKENSYFVLCII